MGRKPHQRLRLEEWSCEIHANQRTVFVRMHLGPLVLKLCAVGRLHTHCLQWFM
jgi:hypothetical protein